jgi:hypothetical protein
VGAGLVSGGVETPYVRQHVWGWPSCPSNNDRGSVWRSSKDSKGWPLLGGHYCIVHYESVIYNKD